MQTLRLVLKRTRSNVSHAHLRLFSNECRHHFKMALNVGLTIMCLVVMVCYVEGTTTDERLDKIEQQMSTLSTLQTYLHQVRVV